MARGGYIKPEKIAKILGISVNKVRDIIKRGIKLELLVKYFARNVSLKEKRDYLYHNVKNAKLRETEKDVIWCAYMKDYEVE